MNTLTHNGYRARVEFDVDVDDRIFVGHIIGIRDIVAFHGESVNELEAAFREAMDDYLAACKKLEQAPDKPNSGRVTLRLPLDLHARARRPQGQGPELQPVGHASVGASGCG